VTELSILKVKLQYEEGKRNVLADALSRMESKERKDGDVLLLSQNIEKFLKNKIVTIDGVQFYKQGGRLKRIIQEDKENFRLIELAHNIGHEGVYKTYHRIKPNYYWKGMNKDIYLYIKCCPKCQMYKPQNQNINTESIPTKPGLPFTRVGLDLVGPLPITKRVNKYIIVLVDYLTMWVEAEPLKYSDSNNVIRFLKNVFARHGIPELLVTDNGP